MIRIHQKNAQLCYTLVHLFYWTIYGFVHAFGAMYLLHQGFTSSEAGVVLGLGHLTSVIMQPVVAAIFERTGIKLTHGIALLYAFGVLCSLAVLLLPVQGIALAALIVLIYAVAATAQPSLTTLTQSFEAAGAPVHYGVARGLGSLIYAIVVAIMGVVLESISPLLLPVFYLVTMLLLIAFLCMLSIPEGDVVKKPVASKETAAGTLLSNPWFVCLLIATAGFSLNALVTGTYMIQIMQDIGGGSTEMGVAIAIAAAVECPAMFLYNRFARRFTDLKMLVLCGWIWFLKCGLILVAQSPVAIYAAQMMQFAGYGFFVPANVKYIERMLPSEAFLKGQSLSGAAFSAGSLIAVFAGGFLIDLVGVRNTLAIAQISSLWGAVLLTVSAMQAKKVNPSIAD